MNKHVTFEMVTPRELFVAQFADDLFQYFGNGFVWMLKGKMLLQMNEPGVDLLTNTTFKSIIFVYKAMSLKYSLKH